MKKTKEAQITDWGSELELNENYTYNKDTDSYIVFLKKINKNIVMRGEVHRAIVEAYSNYLGKPSTISDLCRTHSIPRDILTAYLKACRITHSDLPYSNEKIQESGAEELTENLLEKKKFRISQDFSKKDWQKTKELASKYLALEVGSFNPLIGFLENWNPPRYKAIAKPDYKGSDKHIIISLSDVHWGLNAEKDAQYNGENWSIENTNARINDYANKIKEQIGALKIRPQSATILLMGDMLHSLTGRTDKGTELETGPMGEAQFENAFNSLKLFVDSILTIFKEVNVKAVQGNHDSIADHILSMILKAVYTKEPRISFEISRARWLPFKIYDSLFLMEHGYSAKFKSRLPSGGKRTSYIQSLFLSKPELLEGIKSRYYLTADQHHSEIETADYELIMFSTFSSGDKYADNSCLRSRPRQNLLLVGKSGVEQIINIYFD